MAPVRRIEVPLESLALLHDEETPRSKVLDVPVEDCLPLQTNCVDICRREGMIMRAHFPGIRNYVPDHCTPVPDVCTSIDRILPMRP